jgi:hypothetical protein
MNATSVNRGLERLRILGVITGFVLASTADANPVAQLGILQVFIVASIAGLTGIESIFFSAGAAQLSGYGEGSPYQRQSGMNNLAVALVSIFVFLAGWDVYAELTVLLVLLIFLVLSSINHAYAGLKEEKQSACTFTRPLGTVLLIVFTVPFIIRALKYAE